jgi:hypothetical protein
MTELYLLTQGFFIKTNNKALISLIKDRYTYSRMEGFAQHAKRVYYHYYKPVSGGVLVPRYAIFDKEIGALLGQLMKADMRLLNKQVANYHCSKDIIVKSKAIYSSNQKIVLNHVVNRFNSYLRIDENPLRTGCIVVMGTGLGKTFLAMGFIASFKKKTLYITYDEKSLLGAKTTLEQYLSCKIGVYYGKKKTDGDVVIAIIDSLLRAPNEFFEAFGTIIYDEIPEYITDLSKEIFYKSNCFNIGLTATPEKKGLEKIAIDMVGPLLRVEEIKGYNVVEVEFEGIVHVIRYKNKEVIKRQYIDFMSTVKTFVKDEYRVQLIVF